MADLARILPAGGGGGSCRPVGAGAYDTGRMRCAEAGMRPVSYAVRARGAALPLVLSDQLVELRHEVGKLRALSAPAYGRQGVLVDDVLGQLLQAGGLRHFAVFVVRVREEGHVGIDAAVVEPVSVVERRGQGEFAAHEQVRRSRIRHDARVGVVHQYGHVA